MKHCLPEVTSLALSRTPLARSTWQRYVLVTAAAFTLSNFALSRPRAFAVSPPPDGGYPNGNTADGTDALLSLTTGFNNTAAGASALLGNTTGSANTATGAFAL